MMTRILGELEERGLIVVHQRSNRRQVTIKATGKSTAPIGDGLPTGAALADAVRKAAQEAGQPVSVFAAALSSDPAAYLDQLARARQPLLRTVNRIRALLAGEDVPPVPKGAIRTPRTLAGEPVADTSQLLQEAPAPSASSCGRCGARDGHACGCARPSRSFSAPAQANAAVPPRPKGRPRTFDEQLAAVAAGAGLVEVAPMRRAGPEQTLGGVGSAML